MKKEQIYVVIDSEPKRLRALQILKDSGDNILKNSLLLDEGSKGNLRYTGVWFLSNWKGQNKTEITTQQLEEILNPKESIDQLTENFKSKAKELGFKVDIVFEGIEPRIGTFGKFRDDSKRYIHYGTLTSINVGDFDPFENQNEACFINFQPLTQSEIAELTKNNPK